MPGWTPAYTSMPGEHDAYARQHVRIQNFPLGGVDVRFFRRFVLRGERTARIYLSDRCCSTRVADDRFSPRRNQRDIWATRSTAAPGQWRGRRRSEI